MAGRSSSLQSSVLILRESDGSETVLELPVAHGSCGPSVVDVRGLYQKAGIFLHDPGFTSTSSCQSSITFIDGATSTLLHGGYAIQDLARNSSYLEVCYLLLHGELPTRSQLNCFAHSVTQSTMLHTSLERFFDGFTESAHPMAIMVGVVGALSSFFHDSDEAGLMSEEQRQRVAVSLVAKMPTIAAMAYKRSIGEPFVYPLNRLSFAANFLRMMFATPCEEYNPPASAVAAIDTIFLLHADHEQNASTSTVRIAGSSEANPYACIACGIASLWGPMHGGANEAVIKMIEAIGTPEQIPTFLAKAKDPKDPFRLMGFGHRVYKSYDPRAIEMKRMCHEVIAEIQGTPLAIRLANFLEIALHLEQTALEDEYFVRRGLFPNVDFYSGITLTAIGIPPRMFTVIFAVGRTPGWVSQWKEGLAEPGRRIYRPRQLYTGHTARAFVPISEREDDDSTVAAPAARL